MIAFKARIDGVIGWFVTDPDATPPRNVSANNTGTPATDLDTADLSGDGKWVAFTTRDPAMVGGDTNAVADVFTRSVGPSSTGPTA